MGRGSGHGEGSGESSSMCCCFSAPRWCGFILLWTFGICLLVGGAIMIGLSENASVNHREIYLYVGISFTVIGGVLTLVATLLSILVCAGVVSLSSSSNPQARYQGAEQTVVVQPSSTQQDYMPKSFTPHTHTPYHQQQQQYPQEQPGDSSTSGVSYSEPSYGNRNHPRQSYHAQV